MMCVYKHACIHRQIDIIHHVYIHFFMVITKYLKLCYIWRNDTFRPQLEKVRVPIWYQYRWDDSIMLGACWNQSWARFAFCSISLLWKKIGVPWDIKSFCNLAILWQASYLSYRTFINSVRHGDTLL